tara:strand:+ start:56 stop:316 length:261 start_codon:yes stop_codon:yes gene_type:complete
MTRYTDEPLVSRQVSRRRTEEQNLKIQQQKDMEQRRIDAPQSAWNQSVAASTDDYMKSALSKVRESSVTLPDTLTRHNGSWMYSNK